MIPEEMSVVVAREAGGPNVLEPGRRPVPKPAAGEVLIRVTAAGVNGPDMVQRKGQYPPPEGASDLLGLEVSGEVVATGKSAGRWTPGDRVAALTNGGGYAEYVAVDARHCLPIPEGVDEIDAGGLPETFFTVWSNIFHGVDLAPGTVFLVHGGAGGIGSTAVQMGAALGLRVFTTAGSAEDCDFCRELGAERAIDFREEDFVEIVRAAGGADVILDIIGGDYVARNIKTARHDARIVQLAFNKGSKVEINLMPIMLKRLVYTGSTLRTRSPDFKAEVARALESRVWPLFAERRLRPVTHTVLPFAEAAKAHAMMESAGHRGKILLGSWHGAPPHRSASPFG
jgi:NADPH:quinone reductase